MRICHALLAFLKKTAFSDFINQSMLQVNELAAAFFDNAIGCIENYEKIFIVCKRGWTCSGGDWRNFCLFARGETLDLGYWSQI